MAVYYLDCEPGLLVHGWIHPVDHALHGAVHWLSQIKRRGAQFGGYHAHTCYGGSRKKAATGHHRNQ
jgi:hypothetical protein